MIASLSLGSLFPIALAAAQLPPPVVATPPGTAPAERMLLAWMPGPAMCDRSAVAATAMRRPLTGLIWPGQPEAPRSVTYRFRLDADGRPLSITRTGAGYVVQGEDIAPSLAASRFTAGPARGECAITYTARLTPTGAAPVADLMSYTIAPTGGALPRAGWDRINPAGATCRNDPPPRPLRRILPDFLALPATPGVGSWSMTGYDLDARGRPIHVRTVEGTGNAALDAAAVKAMKTSRFTSGARTGCLYPLRRSAGTMPAPAIPDRIGDVATAGRCPAGDAWAYHPTPTYPEPWRRRAIEGWAVVGFDVAPWGELGNLRVIASEPGAEFGVEALRLLRGARKAASASGHTGCVDRVRFVMKTPAEPDRPVPSAADQP